MCDQSLAVVLEGMFNSEQREKNADGKGYPIYGSGQKVENKPQNLLGLNAEKTYVTSCHL